MVCLFLFLNTGEKNPCTDCYNILNFSSVILGLVIIIPWLLKIHSAIEQKKTILFFYLEILRTDIKVDEQAPSSEATQSMSGSSEPL